MSGGVRENIDAVIAIDSPQLAASVAREARVAHRVDVAGAYPLPRMKIRHRTATLRLASAPLRSIAGTWAAVRGGVALDEPARVCRFPPRRE